jgi:4-carboxymuconolactone decarboxylase
MNARTTAFGIALLMTGALLGYTLGKTPAARAADAPSTGLPSDVYADSRSRVPLIKREQLDAAGQAIYDQTAGDSRSIVGLQGPGGIRLYSPKLDVVDRPVNQFLRFNAGLDPKLVEIAILATAREMDQRFEWYAHELNGLKVGVPLTTIDIIRYRRPTAGLGEKESVLIALGREAVGKHTVSSATFATAERLFGREALINYVSLMGDYAGTGLLLTTFDQQLPAGQVSKLPVP